jgi:hypothetical protein
MKQFSAALTAKYLGLFFSLLTNKFSTNTTIIFNCFNTINYNLILLLYSIQNANRTNILTYF